MTATTSARRSPTSRQHGCCWTRWESARPISCVVDTPARTRRTSAGSGFRELHSLVLTAVSAGTRRVYGTYWDRVIQAWGPRPITSVTPLEISQLAEQVKANVVERRNARGGRGAAEHLIAALRCMYKLAVADGILIESENPAVRVPKARRLRSTCRALPDSRLEELLPGRGLDWR